MSAYGQSIPVRIYRSFIRQDLNKNQTFDELAKILVAVGMRPIPNASLFELGTAGRGGTFDPYPTLFVSDSAADSTVRYRIYAFDFPTDETFLIDGKPYRPFVYLSTSGGNLTQSTDATSYNRVTLFYGIRPATSKHFTFARVYTFDLFRVNYAGEYDDNWGMTMNTGPSSYGSGQMEGAHVKRTGWIHYSGENLANHVNLLTVNHWFAYLGPAGLVVALGTATSNDDQDKSTLFNLMNVGLLFGGARIPNRARMPIADLNLNRIDPIVVMLGHESGGVWNGNTPTGGNVDPTYTHYTALTAVQFDLKINLQSAQAVYARLYNLDNVDLPYPTSQAPTQILRPIPSPRVVNGNARHVLSRLIYVVRHGCEVGGRDYTYCPYDDDYNVEMNRWEDCFCALSVRFTDNRAPIGLYTDPDTSVPWWLHYWNVKDTGVALLATGATVLNTLPAFALGAPVTYPIDITGSTLTQSYLTTATVLQAGSASVPRMLGLNHRQSGSQTFYWQVVPGQNMLEIVSTNTSAQETVVELPIMLPENADTRLQYRLEFDASLVGGAENSATQCYLVIDVYESVNNATGAWLAVYQLLSAGANVGHASYTFSTRAPVGIAANHTAVAGADYYTVALGNGPCWVGLRLVRNGGTAGTVTCRVGNFRLVGYPVS